MKIVSVMTTESSGGAEFAAVEMLDALAERGHEAVMLSNQAGIARGLRVTERPVELGPKLSARTWPGLAVRSVPTLRRLRAALSREAPYDVLLVHFKKEQLLASRLDARLRATLAWCEWGRVPYQFARGVPRRMYLGAARRARLVMAISEGTRASVAAIGVPPALVEVVPNAVRTDEIDFTADGRARVRAALGVPDGAVLVGCISRFNRKKRNDVLVEAVKRLDDPRVHLLLAGDGETEADLRAAAAPLGDRAHFAPMPREDLASVLSALDLDVFCPSPTEGQPRAVIVGMLARRPVLCTGAEGVTDMLAPWMDWIAEREHDPAAFAALLRRYLDDPERARREGEAARAHAEATYAAPVVAERIERLLRAAGAGA